MKLSYISQRVDKYGRHNDRNFDVSHSNHIDENRVNEDRFWIYSGATDISFKEAEMQYYNDHFQQYLDDLNERAKKNRNERKTMRDLWRGLYTRPEDVIIQVGNMYDHIDGDTLWDIMNDYLKRFDDLYGSNCKIVDMALHMDEATPHGHFRRVWSWTDEKGLLEPGRQGKALAAMGILPADVTAPNTKRNNSKIIFTRDDRELIRSIVLERGIDLEPDTPGYKTHLSVAQYKLSETQKDIEMAQHTLRQIEASKIAAEEKLKLAEARTAELLKKGEEIELRAAEEERSFKEMMEAMLLFLQSPYFGDKYRRQIMELKHLSEKDQIVLATDILTGLYGDVADDFDRNKEKTIIVE